MNKRPAMIGLPPGAKILGIALPPRLATTYPSGSVIAEFSVPGRPVPWSVPPKLRRKSRRLVAWQRCVNLAARVAMAGRLPHDGPVEWWMVFCLCRKPWGDTINLAKATEDALEGVVFVNDRQVAAGHPVRVAVADEGKEGVGIEVRACGPRSLAAAPGRGTGPAGGTREGG